MSNYFKNEIAELKSLELEEYQKMELVEFSIFPRIRVVFNWGEASEQLIEFIEGINDLELITDTSISWGSVWFELNTYETNADFKDLWELVFTVIETFSSNVIEKSEVMYEICMLLWLSEKKVRELMTK